MPPAACCTFLMLLSTTTMPEAITAPAIGVVAAHTPKLANSSTIRPSPAGYAGRQAGSSVLSLRQRASQASSDGHSQRMPSVAA